MVYTGVCGKRPISIYQYIPVYTSRSIYSEYTTHILSGEGGEDNEPSTQREDLEARQGAKDVWAIGAVGWELLHYYETGRFSPLVSNLVGEGGAVGTPLAGIALLTQGVPPPPAPGGPELARVRDIVDAALAIDPDRRPTAAQIEASLRSLPSAKEPA